MEHSHISMENAPSFKPYSDKELDDRPSSLKTKTSRFNLNIRPRDDTGVITIHHPDTGEHLGSIYYNKVGDNGHRITEIVKKPNDEYPKMMHEVISHLADNHGRKFISSTSMTDAGESVWRGLAPTHNVTAVTRRMGKPKAVQRNIAPTDVKKHRENVRADKAHKEFWLGGKK